MEGLLDELHRCVRELADLDVFELEPAEVRDAVVGIERARAVLDAAASALLGRFDSETMAASDGFRTTRSWLTQRCHMSGATAGRRVRVARALRELPLVRQRFDDGAFSMDQVDFFARAHTPRTAAAMQTDQAALVELASGLTPDDFASELRGWIDAVDADGTDPDPDHLDRAFTLSQTFGGTWFGDLRLGDADGAVVRSALDAMCDELYRQEQSDIDVDPTLARTASQRRADALVELIRRGITSDITTATTRQRAAVTLLVPVEDLESGVGARTDTGDRMGPAGTRRLLCDSTVTLVGWSADGVPLSHGRTRRFPTPAQRRALTARDRGCVFPGCDAPPGWCDAHHRNHWHRDHGPTDIDNLHLVCPHHHTLLHEGGWTVRGDADGTVAWTNPRGMTIDPTPGWNTTAA